MYIRLTNRCNMSCIHCYMRAQKLSKPVPGSDMTTKTYKNAIRIARDRGEFIALGGGEPTIHPRFWEMLGIALGADDTEGVWLATNGKKTKTALALAGIAKGSERFSVALSRDPYHDEIDSRVVETFKRYGLELRDTSRHLSRVGRAADNDIGNDGLCVCGGLVVLPNGDIKPCDCEDAPVIGNVNRGGISDEFENALNDDNYRDSECWTDYVRKTKREKEGAM